MFARLNDLVKEHRVLSSSLLILPAMFVYREVLAYGFVFDDIQVILQNPFIKNPHLWRRIFLGSLFSFDAAVSQGSFYRPLTIFSYWLICRVAGFNPAVYHLALLALYALTILVVYQLGRKLLQNDLAAFAGALLWALHPLHVEVVAWISSMSDIGCTLFCLLGFRIFLRAEEHPSANFRWHAAAALVYLPALFFKEMAFSFPLLVLAYWFCHPSAESWLRRALNWLPYLAAVAACLVLRLTMMGHFSQTPVFGTLDSQVVWAAIGLLGQHAKLFFWPVGLRAFRDFNLAASLRSPWPWAVLLTLGAACVFRHRHPKLSFLALWWAAALMPTLNYRQLTVSIVGDRFSYLGSVGLCLALGYLAFAWLPLHFPKAGQAWIGVGVLAVATFWAVQTMRAVPHWRNDDAFFDYALRVSPDAAQAHVVHALVLQFRENDLNGAAREYRTALRLDAQSPRPAPAITYNAYIGLGQVALFQGREQEALDYFDKAIALSPGDYFAYDAAGSVYFPRGDYGRAAGYFQKAVRVDPQDVNARFFLGTCWMKLGKPAPAAEQFHAAREVDPTYVQAYVAEAAALEAAGDRAEAARVRALIPKLPASTPE